MEHLNYNFNGAGRLSANIKKAQEEVAEMLREKLVAENAEKAAEKASEEVVERAVKSKPIKADSVNIIAGINQVLAGISSRTAVNPTADQTKVPPKETHDDKSSAAAPAGGNTSPDRTAPAFVSANNGSSRAGNAGVVVNNSVQTGGVNNVADMSVNANSALVQFQNLTAGWSSFVERLTTEEPEAYNAKINKLNQIIEAGEAALSETFPNGMPEAPTGNDAPSSEYTQYQNLSREVNIWRCSRFTMIQNYATALLQDYNQQLNAGTAEFTNWPFNDGNITFHVNGQEFDLSNTAFLHLHENGQNFISLTDFWHNMLAGNTNLNNTCCSTADLNAVAAFHGDLPKAGDDTHYMIGSYGNGLYNVNEDPVQEYYYSTAMIAYYKAQIQAINAKLNDPMIADAEVGSTIYNQAQNMRGWIKRAQSEIARHERIIREYCAGDKNMNLDDYNIPGLSPAIPESQPTHAQPVQIPESPEDLADYYNELINKYNEINPNAEIPDDVATIEPGNADYSQQIQDYMNLLNGNNSDEERVLLSLIISALKLGNSTAAEYWRGLYNELTRGEGPRGGSDSQGGKVQSPKSAEINPSDHGKRGETPDVQPEVGLKLNKKFSGVSPKGGESHVNNLRGGDGEENGGYIAEEEIITDDNLLNDISDLGYPHDHHYQALQISTDQDKLSKYYQSLIEKFYAKEYNTALDEELYENVRSPQKDMDYDHNHNYIHIDDEDGEYIQLLKLLILTARGMGSAYASGFWEKLLYQAQQNNNFGFI